MRHPLLAFAALLLTASISVAGPTVGVVVGPDAPKLERRAADDVAALFKHLFDADAAVTNTVPAGVDHLILVGSPATNPAVAKAAGDRWPKLTDQGHILRSTTLGDRKALVVGGGSPVATLWAVYELGHHFGIRPFLHGDVMPEKVPELKLDGINVTLEPVTKVRAWKVLDDSPTGFGGWGLADHKLLLRQLAKLKFNRVVFGINPAKPATLLGGRRFPVSGDTPGRKAFKGVKEFDNTDLAGKTGDARAKALADLAAGISSAARDLGMEIGYPPTLGIREIALAGFLPRGPGSLSPQLGGEFIVGIAAEMPGDLNPGVYFFARRAFEPKLTAKDAHAELFTPILGAASAERVALGFALLDEATALVRKNDPKFIDLSPDMIAKQLKSSDAPPAWWKPVGKLYAGAMDEMFRGIRATFNDPARPVLLYYAKRCELAVHYFAGVEAAKLAGEAKAKGDKEAVVRHLEKATESVYNALNALGDVARDPSDRGAIAVLAEYAYRPLKAELKAADQK